MESRATPRSTRLLLLLAQRWNPRRRAREKERELPVRWWQLWCSCCSCWPWRSEDQVRHLAFAFGYPPAHSWFLPQVAHVAELVSPQHCQDVLAQSDNLQPHCPNIPFMSLLIDQSSNEAHFTSICKTSISFVRVPLRGDTMPDNSEVITSKSWSI